MKKTDWNATYIAALRGEQTLEGTEYSWSRQYRAALKRGY